MPPLKRSPAKVDDTSCRVCLSNNTVMLELFGSGSQPVSYEEDIKKCLSVEVKKGDGLPSKICIKCVGVLGDYRPFVDKTLASEAERCSKSDSTSDSNTNCHYCLTSGNILFPVPETSIFKTKDCFGIEVTAKNQICVRCQFLLEGLHELKLKACAALKHFYLNSVSVKKKLSPSKAKEPSVDDIVDSLKDKFNIEKPQPEKKMGLKEVSVRLQDLAKMFGEELLKGTVSASKVLERLHTPLHVNGHATVKASSSKTPKQQSTKKVSEPNIKERNHLPKRNEKQTSSKKTLKSQPEKKSRRLSKVSDPTETDVSDEAAPEGNKRQRESSEPETQIFSKKSRRRSESERSESEKTVADSSQEKPEKDPETSDLKTDSPEKKAEKETDTEKEEDQNTKESTNHSHEPVSEKKKGSKKSRLKKDKIECDSSSDSFQKPLQPSIVRPAADASVTENGLDSDFSKPRKRTKKVEFAMDLEADDDDDVFKTVPRRKRKLSENDEVYSPKGKGKKKLPQSSDNDDENGLDESCNSKQIALDQPEYLRELDDLLKFTPKATFKPFICSVCHEGYISTVKGKLHKLVVHDPHANLVLKLTRCDDNKGSSEAFNPGVEESKTNSTVKIKVEIKSEAPDEDGVCSAAVEDESKQRKCLEENTDDVDDLFSDKPISSAPLTGNNTDALFNSLFDAPATVDNVEEVSVAAEKTVYNEKTDDNSETGNGNDSVECDPLSVAVSSKENESVIECNKSAEEEISKPECERSTEEAISKPESEKPSEKVISDPDCDLPPKGESSKPESEKSSEKEISNPDGEVPIEEKSSKPECNKSTEEESPKLECEKQTVGESSTSECGGLPEEEGSKPECVKPTEEEKSKVEKDEVKEMEPQKASDVEASDLETESDVKEQEPTLEKNCDSANSQSSDEVQKGEDTHEDSKSKQEEIANPETSESNLCEPTEQKTDKISQIDSEEPVSSSIIEDQLPSAALEDLRNKGSEADVENIRNCSPKPVDNDLSGSRQVEHSQGIGDAVDSTTAAATSEVEDAVEKKYLSICDKDVESCSVMPDSSAVDAEGIIVGDD